MNGPHYYIIVGDSLTWEISFKHKVWGFAERTKGHWHKSSEGDYLAFYVVSPVKKVVGFGRIKHKFVDNEILWPDEDLLKKPVWKYRFQFDSFYVLDDWSKGIGVPPHIMLNTGRKLIERDIFLNLLRRAEKKWQVDLIEKVS